jgi:hypothetical protein
VELHNFVVFVGLLQGVEGERNLVERYVVELYEVLQGFVGLLEGVEGLW